MINAKFFFCEDSPPIYDFKKQNWTNVGKFSDVQGCDP